MNDLLFYKDGIKIMRFRLEAIDLKNLTKDALANLEHFQNQLIIAQNTLDEMKLEVNLSNDEIEKEIKSNIVAVDRRSIEDHLKLREGMQMFEKSFTHIKSKINLFIVEWISVPGSNRSRNNN